MPKKSVCICCKLSLNFPFWFSFLVPYCNQQYVVEIFETKKKSFKIIFVCVECLLRMKNCSFKIFIGLTIHLFVSIDTF